VGRPFALGFGLSTGPEGANHPRYLDPACGDDPDAAERIARLSSVPLAKGLRNAGPIRQVATLETRRCLAGGVMKGPCEALRILEPAVARHLFDGGICHGQLFSGSGNLDSPDFLVDGSPNDLFDMHLQSRTRNLYVLYDIRDIDRTAGMLSYEAQGSNDFITAGGQNADRQ
jgi:hypothetical protein